MEQARYLLFGFFLPSRLLGGPLIGDVEKDQNHGEESQDVEQQLDNLVELVRGYLVGQGSCPVVVASRVSVGYKNLQVCSLLENGFHFAVKFA